MLLILYWPSCRGVVRVMRRAVMMSETECLYLIITSLFYILANLYNMSNTFEHYPNFNMRECEEG